LNQGLSLERVGCARNAGVFILLRILIGSFVFFFLNTIFYVPSEAMLAAIQSVKADMLLFIAIVGALVPMSFFDLVIGFPLNNVLTTVNKNLSYRAAQLRMIEALIFIAGMILLIAEIPLFYQVLLIGLVFYAFHLILTGYLVFISGYFGRVVGVLLIVGGSIGYLFGSLTGFFVPSFVWLSAIAIVFAIFTEIVLAIALIITAKRTTFSDPDSKTRVIKILKNLGEATTTEIIAEASKASLECRDRVPRTLKALENDNEVSKRFSKEKKGFVWTLVD